MTNDLSQRIAHIFDVKQIPYEAKKMFGGVCYMVNDKMCIGANTDKLTGYPRLISRVGDDFYKEALTIPYASTFNLTGRPMKGFVFVSFDGLRTDEALTFWIQKCLDYNPLARKSKK